MDRLLVVGLDEAEFLELKPQLTIRPVYCDMLPRIRVDRGCLYVEKPNSVGSFLPVSKVIYHGIFEDDLPFISALALWGGPCLPNARGMMDCRQRLPGLVRAAAVTRFGSMRRGFADRGTVAESTNDAVAKVGRVALRENRSSSRRMDLRRADSD